MRVTFLLCPLKLCWTNDLLNNVPFLKFIVHSKICISAEIYVLCIFASTCWIASACGSTASEYSECTECRRTYVLGDSALVPPTRNHPSAPEVKRRSSLIARMGSKYIQCILNKHATCLSRSFCRFWQTKLSSCSIASNRITGINTCHISLETSFPSLARKDECCHLFLVNFLLFFFFSDRTSCLDCAGLVRTRGSSSHFLGSVPARSDPEQEHLSAPNFQNSNLSTI